MDAPTNIQPVTSSLCNVVDTWTYLHKISVINLKFMNSLHLFFGNSFLFICVSLPRSLHRIKYNSFEKTKSFFKSLCRVLSSIFTEQCVAFLADINEIKWLIVIRLIMETTTKRMTMTKKSFNKLAATTYFTNLQKR